MTSPETLYRSTSLREAEIIAARLSLAFPEIAGAIRLTGDADHVIDESAPGRFIVELREHGYPVACLLKGWLQTPRLDDVGTAYQRARVAYEIGRIDATQLLMWLRENELA